MKLDTGLGVDVGRVAVHGDVYDTIKVHTLWVCEKWSEEACAFVRRHFGFADNVQIGSDALRKWVGDPDDGVREIVGNLLLNEGIQELWDLAIAAGGTTAYNNANAEIGNGDSSTAATATQTDLQAATNKLFKAMVATYPQRTNQTVDFRSDFTTAEANWAWQEWSIRNGNTRNKNLNRKVESLGTKTTGTWTLTASVTLS